MLRFDEILLLPFLSTEERSSDIHVPNYYTNRSLQFISNPVPAPSRLASHDLYPSCTNGVASVRGATSEIFFFFNRTARTYKYDMNIIKKLRTKIFLNRLNLISLKYFTKIFSYKEDNLIGNKI